MPVRPHVTARVIDGRALGAIIEKDLTNEAKAMEKRGRAPHLVVVIVGDDAASHVYVRNKQRACERIGIKSTRGMHIGLKWPIQDEGRRGCSDRSGVDGDHEDSSRW